MRIVFVGSHGVGKTTLAERVCLTLNKIGNVKFTFISTTRKAREAFEDVWEGEEVNECSIVGYRLGEWTKAGENFVSDRSLLDPVVYATTLDTVPEQTKYLLSQLAMWSFGFIDYIFYIPISIDLVDDGVRYIDPKLQKTIDSGIILWLDQAKIPYIKLESVELEERVAEVIKHVIESPFIRRHNEKD